MPPPLLNTSAAHKRPAERSIRMKVVIAIDSLKGSLTSMEAGGAIRDGISAVMSEAKVVVKPLADGGEGTVEAFVNGMNGREIKVMVSGPLGEPLEASYAMLEEAHTAVIEMASAAGLTLIEREKRNPMNTTTYGVGQLILDALDRGLRNFIIGIGGSATNDGGLGMLEALGVKFYDQSGAETGVFGRDMLRVSRVELSGLDQRIRECHFRIACDVNNPLCGPNGASRVFGPQKGADENMVQAMDEGLLAYAEKVEEAVGKKLSHVPGTGAAGGLGFAFLALLDGHLEPGISIILDAVGLEEEIKDADIVITGEGRLDFQTAMGKAPIGVAELAKKYNKKVLAFSGCATEDAQECNQKGIDAYFPILQMPVSAEEAMKKDTAYKNMVLTVKQVFGLVKALGNG